MALLHRDRTDTDDTVAGPTDLGADHVPPERVVRKNSFGQTLRTILATVLVVALAAVIVVNTDRVDVDLLFESYDVSLAALLAGSAGVGLLTGLLLGFRRRH